MVSYNIVHDLVKKTLRNTPLPEDLNDLDEVSRRRIEERAHAQGVTPANLYEVIKTQQAEDLKEAGEGDFDPVAIARAARSGPFTTPSN